MKKFACATAVLGLMLVTNISMAGTKPLVGLPDYNGTYYGTPNTGSLYDSATNRFTVLYRDNYERETAGCAGEGCGKHPGIDIRIPSGTAVKASFGGTVIKSECNATWGGLIIIEADNPYIAGEKVYISYAHLRDRSVFLNDVVTEGQVIGESGGEDGLDQNGIPNGKTPDTCFGSSTGAHLHFQVDRPHGDTYPWYPSGTTNSIPNVEYKDSDFGVTTKTYNPLPFIQGYGYHWNFSENGFKELWTATNVNGSGVVNSAFWIDSEQSNAYMFRSGIHYPSCGGSDGYPCSREVTIETDVFKRWVLYLDFKCTNNPVVVWFWNNSSNFWSGITFNYDGPGYYSVPMTISPYWTGIVTDLLIQPSYGGGCTASPGPEEFFVYQTYFLP